MDGHERLRRALRPWSPAAPRASAWPPRGCCAARRAGARARPRRRRRRARPASPCAPTSPTTPRSAPPSRRRPSGSAASTSWSTTPASARPAPSPTTPTTSGTGCSTSTCSAWSGSPGRRCRTCAPSEHAAIVNTCSIAATAGLPQRALYSATKGAVLSLTLAMAADHVREGIRVNCVNPGTADTPWVRRLLAAADDPDAERAALRGPPAHRPAGHRRGGGGRDRLPGQPAGQRSPPARCSPSTAACTACACGRPQ